MVLEQRQEPIYRRDRLERQPVVSRNLVLIADARLLNPGALADDFAPLTWTPDRQPDEPSHGIDRALRATIASTFRDGYNSGTPKPHGPPC